MAVSLKRVKCVHGKWGRYDCDHCIREDAELMYLDREIAEIEERDRIVREYLPASEREWEERLESWDPDDTIVDIRLAWEVIRA